MKFARNILVLLFLLWLSAPLHCGPVATAIASDPTNEDNGAAPLFTKEDHVGIQTQKVETAGKKVGQGIDRLEDVATRRMGNWIAKESFAGITWLKLGFCLLLLFVVVLVERLLQLFIQIRLKGLPAEDTLIPWSKLFLRSLSRPLTLFIWVYGIYFAISPLFVHFQQPDGKNLVHLIALKAADIGGTIAIVWFLFRMVSLLDVRLIKWATTTESTIDDMLAPLVGKTMRIFIVSIGGIILIQNLTGIEVGPLIASLGIGGLAFALAGKDSVANFLGTMTILFDKPFQVGERIVITDYDGVVESVGFRSTRIRTLTGHLVSIPNEKVINTSVENIGRRPHIRWLTNITITYDTPPEKVEAAVRILEQTLENHEGMHPDFPPRVFFNGFNDWSLNIMVVAWYHPPNYWDYQVWLQKTCLTILSRFNQEGIDFAFPSRTFYLANDDKRQAKLQILKGEA